MDTEENTTLVTAARIGYQQPSWAQPATTFVTSLPQRHQGNTTLVQPPSSLLLARHVVPYLYTFEVHAKQRWFGQPLVEVFAKEYTPTTKDEYMAEVEAGRFTINGTVVTKEWTDKQREKRVRQAKTSKPLSVSEQQQQQQPYHWSLDVLIQQRDLIGRTVRREETPVQQPANGIAVLDIDTELGLFVVSKPASIPVHPCGHYHHNTVVGLLKKIFQPASPAAEQWRLQCAAPQGGNEGNPPTVVDREGHAALHFAPSVKAEMVAKIEGYLTSIGANDMEGSNGQGDETAEEHTGCKRKANNSGGKELLSPPFFTNIANAKGFKRKEAAHQNNTTPSSSSNTFHVVHRLDKSTSGVVMLALHSEASKRLFHLLRDKSNTALLGGVIDDSTGKSFAEEEKMMSEDADKGESIHKVYRARVIGSFSKAIGCASRAALFASGVIQACEWPGEAKRKGEATLSCYQISAPVFCACPNNNLYDCRLETTSPAGEKGQEKKEPLEMRKSTTKDNVSGEKKAVTIVRCIHEQHANGPAPQHGHQVSSLLELIPVTGRSHQLRVHLARGLGLPIQDDTKYYTAEQRSTHGMGGGGGGIKEEEEAEVVQGGRKEDKDRLLNEPLAICLHAWKYVLKVKKGDGGASSGDFIEKTFEAPLPPWASGGDE